MKTQITVCDEDFSRARSAALQLRGAMLKVMGETPGEVKPCSTGFFITFGEFCDVQISMKSVGWKSGLYVRITVGSFDSPMRKHYRERKQGFDFDAIAKYIVEYKADNIRRREASKLWHDRYKVMDGVISDSMNGRSILFGRAYAGMYPDKQPCCRVDLCLKPEEFRRVLDTLCELELVSPSPIDKKLV